MPPARNGKVSLHCYESTGAGASVLLVMGPHPSTGFCDGDAVEMNRLIELQMEGSIG